MCFLSKFSGLRGLSCFAGTLAAIPDCERRIMHMRYAALLLPLLLVPLLFTSPVACGCEPDPGSMAGQMSIYVSPGGRPVSASENQSLANIAFAGKDIRHLAAEGSFHKNCQRTSPTHLECIYWNEVGIVYSSGRVVHVAADATYRVTAVTVSTIRKLFGVSFG